jgi:hypothetical protein
MLRWLSLPVSVTGLAPIVEMKETITNAMDKMIKSFIV